MTIPSFEDVRQTPLRTDDELVPHLQSLLSGAYRRQVWVTLLDDQARPYPVLMPSDVGAEPGPSDAVEYERLFRCLSREFAGTSLVIVFERPGRAEVTEGDLRWLEALRAIADASGCSFRGPYLLLGSSVRAV